MDVFQLIVTKAAIIIVILLMVYFACHLFGPKANAWIRSTREEKIGLSHKKVYNANGFLIQSGSDFLLSSTGSFKRFDSVDRDCKQPQQDARYSPAPHSASTATVSPLWSIAVTEIPGQPLRPAPSPPPPSSSSSSGSTLTPKFFAHSLEAPHHHHHHQPIKQQSLGSTSSSGSATSPSPTIVSTTTSAVPRPIARRQFSSPAAAPIGRDGNAKVEFSPIKLHSAGHTGRPVAPRISTNPFLNNHNHAEAEIRPIVAPLPDLVPIIGETIDSRKQRQSNLSDSAKAPSTNPFSTPPSGYDLKLGDGGCVPCCANNNNKKAPDSSDRQLSSDCCRAEYDVIIKPNSGEPLIFNFDIAVDDEPSVRETKPPKESTGGVVEPLFEMDSNEDLITLEEEGGNNRRHSRIVAVNNEDDDDDRSLWEAEGSIRKLELAREEDKKTAAATLINQTDEDATTTTTNNKFIASLLNGSSNYYEEKFNHRKLRNKYEDSYLSSAVAVGAPSEDTSPLVGYRRFRSHSETEATIFDRTLALNGQKRMLIAAAAATATNNNNPFVNLDGGGAGVAINMASCGRNPLIRSGILSVATKRQDTGNSGPFNPMAMSKTVSETYLGQFTVNAAAAASTGASSYTPLAAASPLARSGSILHMMQQQQQQPPLSPTVPVWAFMGGNGGGSNSCVKGAPPWRRNSATSSGIRDSDTVNVLGEGAPAATCFKRTLSSESVSSQSSVLIADLESSSGGSAGGAGGSAPEDSRQVPAVTGYLCVGLQYDKNNTSDEGAELVVTVLEAKELQGPPDSDDVLDTFVRIYLVPDEERAMQTKLFKNSSCPSYNETFSFWVSSRKHQRHSLWFHLYHSGRNQHTLIGEGELQIGDVKRPLTTWLALSDSRTANSAAHNYGELMFSLSYLPTAERLTVVVVKGRNLQFINDDDGGNSRNGEEANGLSQPQRHSISGPSTGGEGDGGLLSSTSSLSSLSEVGAQPLARKRLSCSMEPVANVLVKVYLLKDGKKVSKKKTTLKRMEASPTWGWESMIFSVPPYMLSAIQIRLTVAQIVPESGLVRESLTMGSSRMRILPIGHVIVGNEATGKGLKHWNQMITSLRKPVAMWHPLRRCPAERPQNAKG